MRWLVLFLLLLPLPALAQDSDTAQTERDRSYLTGLIEDNLSGAGREIRLEGFKGALSSRASFDTLTIADDQGVWLTLRKGAMTWDRAALLLGKVAVEELSAAEIELPRLPVAPPQETAPEAKPFSLPQLPVAVEIGSVKAEKVVLGAPVLGQAAEFRLDGSLRLSGGDGETDLTATRLDGPKGRFALKASYAGDSRAILLDLLLTEAKDGIAAGLIGLPGRPSLTLSMSGLGSLDDFKADVLLGTAGVSRVTGTVALSGKDGARGFEASFGGDLSQLLPAEYRPFFGPDVRLTLAGERSGTGMMRLRTLDLQGQAVRLTGGLDLRPDGLPDRFDLAAQMGLAEGQPVILPLSGAPISLRAGQVKLSYDRARGEGWSLLADLTGLARGADALDRLSLTGSGRIGAGATVGGTLNLIATGLAPADPALAEALGPFASGKLRFFWQKGRPLTVPNLTLGTRDFTALGRLALAEDLAISGHLEADHRKLASLSALAGRALSGSVSADLEGSYRLSSGAFEAEAKLDATDLHLDQAQADALLAGRAQITLSALRDDTGFTLRGLSAAAGGASLRASGVLNSAESTLAARLEAPNLGRLGAGYGGALGFEAVLTGPLNARAITVRGTGRNMALPQADLNRILAGQSQFALSLRQSDGAFHLADLTLSTPQLSASAKPRKDQPRAFDLSTQLSNVALLAPGFPGPLAVAGSVTDQGARYGLDLRGTGPGGSQATVKGTVAADGASVDLTISGRAETALANSFLEPQSLRGPLTFDLALKGKPGLAALSGQIVGSNLRLSAPTLGQALSDVDLQARLTNGTAQIAGQASFEGGGTLELSGPVQLAAPFPARLALGLNRARLRDPELYDTRVSGDLAITGGLTGGLRIGGALTLDDTELRIPAGGLGGAGAIPPMTHLHEPAAVHQTRLRAGLIETGKAAATGSRRAIALDVTVSAPQQIFVRGRGLDAELGGQLRVTGTTAQIVPVGQFGLIRGRLDVLGKRFDLTEGQVALQGALLPWVLFKATTAQEDLDITLTLEGAATEPSLTITSSPDLPEEEVLARLLFNKGLTNLSPLQAAQLASAVATLAGKGGDGIVSKLRQGFGLDDLDVGTDDSGNATVKAGKYLAKNVYSDVSVDSSGQAAVTLNLDITKQITAKATVGSTGSSALGVFFEKDY
ncbi:translocation/assembly module TamB domain-containing protein [Rhodobacter capsulatus]|uniref:translocation/assembly module TamB domain-containing protein n=1 Tax=Rhodobacter capsulatus TaxID=1061 RepID=UPI00402843FF